MNKLIDNNARYGHLNKYNFEWVQGLKKGESVYAQNSGGTQEYYDLTFCWLDTHDLIQVLDFDGDQVVYLNKKTGKQSSYHWSRICSTDSEFQVFIESLDINFIHSFPVRYEKTESSHHFEIRKRQYGKPNEIFEIPIEASGEYFLEMLDKNNFRPMVVKHEELKDLKSKLDNIRKASKRKEKLDPSNNPVPGKKKVVATKKKASAAAKPFNGKLEIGSLFRTNYSSRIHMVKGITSHCTCPVDDGKGKKSKTHIHIEGNYIFDGKTSYFNHYQIVEKKNKTEYICLSRQDKLILLENPVFKIVVNRLTSRFDILWLNCHENDSLVQIMGIKSFEKAQSLAKEYKLTLVDGNIRVEKKFMPGAGWMLIWVDAVDGNNILQSGLKTSFAAEDFAKQFGFILQESSAKPKVVATKKEKPVKPVKATGNKVIEKPSLPEQPKPTEPKTEETKDDLIKFRCSSSFKAEVKRLCEKRGHNNVSLLMIEAINLLKAI